MATLPSWTPPKSRKPKIHEVATDGSAKVVTRDATPEEEARINAEEEARIVARRNAEAEKEAPVSSVGFSASATDEGEGETATLDAPATETAPETPKAKKTKEKTMKTATATKNKATKSKKAAPAKTKPTPAPKAETNGAAKKGPGRPKGVFAWTEKRVAIVKALRSMKATSEEAAETAEAVAKKAEVSEQDVKHYCYKDNDLVKKGYVAVAKGNEKGRLLAYYLTAEGAAAAAEAKVAKN